MQFFSFNPTLVNFEHTGSPSIVILPEMFQSYFSQFWTLGFSRMVLDTLLSFNPTLVNFERKYPQTQNAVITVFQSYFSQFWT